jgi:hypothetical protein
VPHPCRRWRFGVPRSLLCSAAGVHLRLARTCEISVRFGVGADGDNRRFVVLVGVCTRKTGR